MMFSSAVFGSGGPLADSEHLTGALVVTVAVLAMGEVIRAARLLNIPLGLWTIAAPWLLSGAAPGAKWSALAAGAALIVLSIRRGRPSERYGSWERFIV